MSERVARGPAYRDEMFRWIETGIGKEGDIRQFLPEHALHFGVLLILSLVTGGAGALVLGAFLLNYMNFYVGSLLAAAESPLTVALFGWPVWSVCRVIGFVLAATAVAGPIYRRFRSVRADLAAAGPLLRLGLLFVAADIALKFLLASTWRRILGSGLHG